MFGGKKVTLVNLKLLGALVFVLFFAPLTANAAPAWSSSDLGMYCPPYSSDVGVGAFVEYTSDFCTYILKGGSITSSGAKYMTPFAGAVGSSTAFNGHFLGSFCNDGVCESNQVDDWNGQGMPNGSPMFFIVYQATGGGCEFHYPALEAYLETGTGSEPCTAYGIFPMVWAPLWHTVSGNISSNTTWLSGHTYKVSGDIAVNSGVTLTVQPGAIVKFDTATSSNLIVNGTLTAAGSTASTTVFTSVKDDLFGGDFNGDGTSTTPAAGDWGNIIVNSGGTATIGYGVIRYGGDSGATDGMIRNNGGVISIATSSVVYSETAGIRNTSGTTNVTASDIGFNNDGLYLAGGSISVTGTSTIHDNVQYGAFNNTSATSSFTATNNYWATASATAATGPYHPTLNPSGTGDEISSYVDFDPWIGKAGTTSLPHYIRPDCPITDCSSVQNRMMLLDAVTTYTSELDAAITEWNTLGKVTIEEATSTVTVELFQDSRPDLPIKGGFGTSTTDFIFLNSYFLDQNSFQQRQHTIMHELGHALGLDHSFSGNIMNFFQTSQVTFGAQDYLDYHFMWP
jgi:hypothetical protein